MHAQLIEGGTTPKRAQIAEISTGTRQPITV
jgi:hypothetical protein